MYKHTSFNVFINVAVCRVHERWQIENCKFTFTLLVHHNHKFIKWKQFVRNLSARGIRCSLFEYVPAPVHRRVFISLFHWVATAAAAAAGALQVRTYTIGVVLFISVSFCFSFFNVFCVQFLHFVCYLQLPFAISAQHCTTKWSVRFNWSVSDQGSSGVAVTTHWCSFLTLFRFSVDMMQNMP